MRILSLVSGLSLMLCLACSGDDAPADGGAPVDAAARDAGPTDGGASGPEVSCGAATCDGAREFCREDQVAPCAAVDGGTCGDEEEACNVDNLTSGCTPAIPRTCAPLPQGCDNCVCIIDSAPCGPGVAVTCNGTAQLGLTLRCPP